MSWDCVCGAAPHEKYRISGGAERCERCGRTHENIAYLGMEQTMAGAAALPRGPAVEHYNAHKIQPIEFILANDIPHCEACVIKYVVRWRNKNGVADLKKARDYIDFLINQAEKGSPL